jgi:hypothetical protein
MVYKTYASKKSKQKQTSSAENPADVIWKELDDVYNEILKLYKKQKKAKSGKKAGVGVAVARAGIKSKTKTAGAKDAEAE